MDQIINHAVLSLDFWQDTVTYEGCTMPISLGGYFFSVKLRTPKTTEDNKVRSINTSVNVIPATSPLFEVGGITVPPL